MSLAPDDVKNISFSNFEMNEDCHLFHTTNTHDESDSLKYISNSRSQPNEMAENHD